MSRIQVPIKPGVDATEAWCGFDRPLATYFAQVFRGEPDCETELLWAGTSPGELATPTQVIELLMPYCEIPPEFAQTLEIDRMKSLAQSDGPNQIEAKEFLRRLGNID